MPTPKRTEYPLEPDYAVAPGETLQETIDALGMTQAELAVRTGLSTKTINLVIKGTHVVTQDTAIKLGRATGVPVDVWNRLEMNYRRRLAEIEDRKRIAADHEWLKTIPTKELIALGVLPTCSDRADLLKAVFGFFGVSSSEAWRRLWLENPSTAYRRSQCFALNPAAAATWLRLGELKAQKVECRPYDQAKFKKALLEIRCLTADLPDDFQDVIVNRCKGAGVAAVFVPELKKCPVSGAARWLTPEKALVQLSLRYKTDDQIWFSFFHEAGHILNDSKKQFYIDDKTTQGEQEKKANQFAQDFLIPPARRAELQSLCSEEGIATFAGKIGIAPGIVVGRMQREGIILFSRFNGLKRRFQWVVQ
ncbi:MAG: helix-turn-helix domain-containing protein [Planctomycetota bacterium]|nr:helix-turn-helix domain-containing protein [Planctomycetota bacterium]